MIIDLSGVPIIDTMVADQLFKVMSSLQLVGIEPKLRGIRPESCPDHGGTWDRF
jgi:rsbT co-antagonist protein RsbR